MNAFDEVLETLSAALPKDNSGANVVDSATLAPLVAQALVGAEEADQSNAA